MRDREVAWAVTAMQNTLQASLSGTFSPGKTDVVKQRLEFDGAELWDDGFGLLNNGLGCRTTAFG